MVKTDEGTDSDQEIEKSKSSSSDSEDDMFYTKKRKGPKLNSRGNSEDTQKCIDDRKRNEKNEKRRRNLQAKKALDPVERSKARVKAKKQHEKDIADEQKAEDRAEKKENKARALAEAAGKKKKASKKFTPEEIDILNSCVSKVLPCGSDDWNRVVNEINKVRPDYLPIRDLESYRLKFYANKNILKPTGSASMPDQVRILPD